jgi:biopolymer transport protein ExbB/TolQ
MLSAFFMKMTLLGSEWVLWLLLLTSLISITLIFERFLFYKDGLKDGQVFNDEIRKAVHFMDYEKALQISRERIENIKKSVPMDAHVALSLIERKMNEKANQDPSSFSQVGQDAILRSRLFWEKNLSMLASIGSNAPFVGLFGTVLGIIQAFDTIKSGLESGGASGSVTAGLADALIATAIGILVAIPAVIFYNIFSRKVDAASSDAEALMNYIISHLSRGTK